MALTVVSLDHGVNSSGSPFASNSITPGTNTLVLAFLMTNSTIPSGVSIDNGDGLTWVNIQSDINEGSGRALNIWRAMASSPSAGPITFRPNSAAALYEILEVQGGVDTSGTNGSGANRQDHAAFGSSPLDAGLSASLATSALIGAIANRDNGATVTVGSGYTQLNNFADSTVGLLATQWRTGVTTGACGWSFSNPASLVVWGLEAQVPSSAPFDPATGAAAWLINPDPLPPPGKPRMVASGHVSTTRLP